MQIKQLSIFLENTPGRLAEVTKTLAEININLYAMTIAETADFGILRIIVSDYEKAKKSLKDKGFTVSLKDVIGVALKDKPGDLYKLLTEFAGNGISIEYLYAFTSHSKEYDAMVILRLNNLEKAIEIIEKSSEVELVTQECLRSIDSTSCL